jgi:hypothetical protein
MTIKGIKYFFHRVIHWEYWPQNLVYAPIIPIYLYYAAQKRTPFFNIAANPFMENGGFLMESKYEIYKQLPQELIPRTILISNKTDFEKAKQWMIAKNILFPCICKPDIGGKGVGVEVVDNEVELLAYHTKINVNYIIQEKVSYKEEVGIFYCRYPNEEKGFVTGIVGKKDMQVTGDGKNSLQQLIDAVPRFYFQRKYLFNKFGEEINRILSKDEVLVLSTIGNHSRGSEFINLSHLITPALTVTIDKISKDYNTFYFGRYDIMFDKWEDLNNGKNFSVIELNGSGSEPTHLYDSTHPIWKAWKIIIQHWKIMNTIAKQHHNNNVPYTSYKEGKKLQQQYETHEKNIKATLYPQ